MIRQFLLLSAVWLLFITTTGCWSLREVESVYYPNTSGIDYRDGKYYIYVQVFDLTAMGKGKEERGGGENGGIWIGMGKGRTVDQAIHDLYSVTGQMISWGQLSSVVLTEGAMRKGAKEVIDLMNRYFDIRSTVWVFGTETPLDRLLKSHAIIFKFPLYTRLGNPDRPYKQRSYIEPKQYYEVLRTANDPARTLLIPSLGLVDQWKTGGKSTPQVEFSGMYSMKKYRMGHHYDRAALSGMRWMTPDSERSALTLSKKGKVMADVVLGKPSLRIFPKVSGDQVSYDVYVRVKGMLLTQQRQDQLRDLEALAAKEVAGQIRHTFKKGVKKGDDLYNLTQFLYRKKPNEWKRLKKKGKLDIEKETLDRVEVDVNLLTSGKEKLRQKGR